MVAMDQLFGRDDENREELFQPENGITMCVGAETYMENGWIVLILDVPDDATIAQLDTWSKVKKKEYKLRVLCPEKAGTLHRVLSRSLCEHGCIRWIEWIGVTLALGGDDR